MLRLIRSARTAMVHDMQQFIGILFIIVGIALLSRATLTFLRTAEGIEFAARQALTLLRLKKAIESNTMVPRFWARVAAATSGRDHPNDVTTVSHLTSRISQFVERRHAAR